MNNNEFIYKIKPNARLNDPFEFSTSVVRGVCKDEIENFIERIIRSNGEEIVSYREDTVFSEDCRREFQSGETNLWRKLEIFKELNDTNARREIVEIDLLKRISGFLVEKGENQQVWSALEMKYIENALIKNKTDNYKQNGSGSRFELVQEKNRENKKIRNQIINQIVEYIRKELDRRIQKRVNENPIGQMSWKNKTPKPPNGNLKIDLKNQNMLFFFGSIVENASETMTELINKPEDRNTVSYFFETIFKTPKRTFYLYILVFVFIILVVFILKAEF